MNKVAKFFTPPRPVILDIMIGSRFVCQLLYKEKGRSSIIDGKCVVVHDANRIKQYVEDRLPTLRGVSYTICFTDNRIPKRY